MGLSNGRIETTVPQDFSVNMKKKKFMATLMQVTSHLLPASVTNLQLSM